MGWNSLFLSEGCKRWAGIINFYLKDVRDGLE
jgi:hypothetical protein